MPPTQPTYRQTTHLKLKILADVPAVAVATTRHIRARASSAIAISGQFTIALSGGETPKAVFAELIKEHDLNWSKVHVFWGDERCVPSTHPDSNYRLAHDHFLSRVPIPKANIHRVQTELGAKPAAEAYTAELRAHFKLDDHSLPRFDMVLLGMGDDGHTASLFPYTAALHNTQQLVVSNAVPKLGVDRITMTYPLLNAAAWVIVHICGQGKSAAVKAVLDSPPQVERLPMQGIRPMHGELAWLVDQAAAAALDGAAGQA
ncbi:MAG: 6-phosphogluconolactonase [Proteobacteria bacterium]|nr:6-phosphogluconolactonase [Pseudomonadota bacterium]